MLDIEYKMYSDEQIETKSLFSQIDATHEMYQTR